MTKEEKIIAIQHHVESIMSILGVERNNSTVGTPSRVAKMYVNEVFKNVNNENIEELNDSMTCFNKNFDGNELVIVKDIPFYSMCEHHLMPFSCKITVGYVPNTKIIGLSKIPRVVKYFSKKPQLQERLVNEIADYLQDLLGSDALFVLATDTIHTCVSARGIETYCETDTIACRGEEQYQFKSEFYTRVKGR